MKKIDKWVERANALNKLNDWQGLLDWSLKWTESEPENPAAWYNRGIAYSYLKRHNDAIEAFTESLLINPEDADSWGLLGIANFDLNHYNDAIKAFRESLLINPENVDVRNLLGIANINLNRYEDAIKAFRESLLINTENADSWFYLGMSYFELERNDEAREAFNQVLHINPDYANDWYRRGTSAALYGDLTAVMEAVNILEYLDLERAEKLSNLIKTPDGLKKTEERKDITPVELFCGNIEKLIETIGLPIQCAEI
jgi:tetratricopeptide (TPR) repeat protein